MSELQTAEEEERVRAITTLWAYSPRAEGTAEQTRAYVLATQSLSPALLEAAVRRLIRRGWRAYPWPPGVHEILGVAGELYAEARQRREAIERRARERRFIESWSGADLEAEQRQVLEGCRADSGRVSLPCRRVSGTVLRIVRKQLERRELLGPGDQVLRIRA